MDDKMPTHMPKTNQLYEYTKWLKYYELQQGS